MFAYGAAYLVSTPKHTAEPRAHGLPLSCSGFPIAAARLLDGLVRLGEVPAEVDHEGGAGPRRFGDAHCGFWTGERVLTAPMSSGPE